MNLTPYEEVTVSWNPDNTILNLNTPWLSFDVAIEEEQVLSLKETTKKVNKKISLGDSDVQDFLAFFNEFPVVNFLPREEMDIDTYYGLYPQEYLSDSPAELTEKIMNDFDRSLNTEKMSMSQSWTWDVEKVLAKSNLKNQNGYDPKSVYSALVELRYKTENKNNKTESFLDELKDLLKNNEDQFFDAMAFIIRQSLHITESCCDSLNPALHLLEKAKSEVKYYIRSEEGHDAFVRKTLKSILQNKSASDIKLLPEVSLSMAVLKAAAAQNYLAFSTCVSVFESSGFRESDAYADLLRESSRPEAASGLDTHFKINKAEEHAKVGLDFIDLAPAMSKEAVIHATRLMELLTIAGKMMDKSILQYISKVKA
jgi:hypothetical protein